MIKVTFSDMDTALLNGGSAILGYDLWRDDGLGGDFFSLFGSRASSDQLLALMYSDFNVTKSMTYRYRYRARNINGWGPFSDDAYLFAASKPATPAEPILITVDDNGMQI